MKEIIGVKFKKTGKIYFFDPAGISIETGKGVIVETVQGIELGEVAVSNQKVADEKITEPLKTIIRVATENDMLIHENNLKKSKEALVSCAELVQKHKLDMKLVDSEYTFDGSKLIFYFTADGRIDFRELVKDLAAIFRTRIELRQIGVRDEVKMLGGFGMCGRELCCCTHIGDLNAVSIKMAKEQGLSLNPTKISGACGRLMCCLKHENEVYEEKLSRLPRAGAIVSTPEGQGVVEDVQILKELIKVRVEKDGNTEKKVFAMNDIKVIKDSRKEAEAEEENKEELKKLEEE